jgi:GTPase SAR1 family protein
MLVGDCGVGKASIREAFTNDSFSGESKQADKSSVEVYTDNTLVELVITVYDSKNINFFLK